MKQPILSGSLEKNMKYPRLREPDTFQDCEMVSGVTNVPLGEPLQTSGAASEYVLNQTT